MAGVDEATVKALLGRLTCNAGTVLIEQQRVINKLRDALRAIEEIADGRADADCVGDPPRFVPNDWMQVLVLATDAL
jgi:hypothetical protein